MSNLNGLKTLPNNLNKLSLSDVIEIWEHLMRVKEAKQRLSALKQACLSKQHPDALPDDPVPRCGWKFFSTDWIFGVFGKEDPFLKCCLIHDIEYELKRKPRAQVDLELYECTKAVAGLNPLLRPLALSYYYIVKFSGGFFW